MNHTLLFTGRIVDLIRRHLPASDGDPRSLPHLFQIFVERSFVLLFVPHVSAETTLLCFSQSFTISAQRSRTLKRCMTSSAPRMPIIHTLLARNQTRKYARSSSSYCPLCCPLSVQKLLVRRTLNRSQRKFAGDHGVLLRFSCLT